MKNNGTSHAGEPSSAPLQSQPTLPRRILVVDGDSYFCHLSLEVPIRHRYQVNAATAAAADWALLRPKNDDRLMLSLGVPE